MPDGPITLDASEVEETPSLSADQVEESAPKQYLPEVNQAVGSVPRPAVPAGLQPSAPPAPRAPLPNPRLVQARAAAGAGTGGLLEAAVTGKGGGEAIPDAAVPALQTTKKVFVDPFDKTAAAISKASGELLEGAAAVPQTARIATGAPPSNVGTPTPRPPIDPAEGKRLADWMRSPQAATQPPPADLQQAATRSTTAPPSVFGEMMEKARAEHPIELGVAKGVGETVGGIVGDPRYLPFFGSSLARPALARLISAGFTAQMGIGTAQGAKELYQNWDQMKPAERAELATKTGITALFLAHGTIKTGGGYEALPKEPIARAESLFRNLIYKAGGTVPENPTFEQANAAYRAAMNNLHPDVNPATAEDAQNLNAAWATMKTAGRFAQAPPVPTPTRNELAEHLDRTHFESGDAARASYVAEKQAQEAPVEAKAKAPEPEVIPPTKPSPAAPEVAKPIVLEANQVEEAQKPATVSPKESRAPQGAQPAAVGKPAPEPVSKPAAESAPVVTKPGVEETPATPSKEQPSEKPEIVKGGKVELADGRRATIEYAAPADKLPVVRLSTEDGEKVKLTSQKEIDGLKAATKYKHGNTQANIPEGSEAAKGLEIARQIISGNDLAGKGTDVDGDHVTVKYGIKSDDTEGIKKYLASLAPFEATLGKTAAFPPSESSDGAAVIHAPIESPELQKINAEIGKHGDFAPSNFDSYKPHATIAYVKPDKAGRYVGMTIVQGKKFPVNEIAITDKNGGQTVVKLEGKKEPSRSPTGRLSTPEELAVQNQPGITGVAKDIDKWQPPPELGAFPNTPDVGAKARAQVDKESGPLKRGEERRKVDRTGQQAEDKLFNQARKELGEDATTEQIEKRIQELRKPVVGSPEYEAIKAKIAKLETKPSPKKPSFEDDARARVSQRLRTLAENLDKQIEDKRRPMEQNPTPKRMAQYRSRMIDADEMERTQKALRALADAHEAGNVPPELAGLRSKEEIARLVHKGLSGQGGYYDRIPSSEYRDKTPAGKKLQEMIEGAKSPEATAAKLAKEKASKIAELEADVQFRPLPGYFPTPKPVVEKMLDAADIKRGMSVLEPSAGKGNIADAIREKAPDAKLSVVEQAPKLQEILKLKDHNLVDSDFMEHDSHYDRIVMNPPFEKGADVEHVRHAFELLKPGGRLVAIMSPHAEFANDKKSVAFREWVDSLGGESEKLPESSFKESGTGVASRMVTIDKPEATKPAVAAKQRKGAKEEIQPVVGATYKPRSNLDLPYTVLEVKRYEDWRGEMVKARMPDGSIKEFSANGIITGNDRLTKQTEASVAAGETQPELRVVPGARSSKTGNETGKTSIQDLTDSISRQVPEKRPLKDRISRGADIGEKTGNAKDSLGRAYDRIKGAASALWDAYGRPPKWTDYEDLTGKWSGADQINALDLERFSKAIVRAVPEKLRREAISNWIESGGDEAVLRDRAEKSAAPYKKGYEAALNLTDTEKTIARNVMNRNDATLEEAQKAGILQQGVENYVRHVYADSPKYQAKVAAEMNFASLQTKPSFTKERKLPTYFDAEQLGFTPKDKDVGYLTAIHERSFREALAARAYVHALMHGKASDGRPLIATSWASAKELSPRDGESSAAYLIKPNIKAEEEFGDYRKLDHPALRGWRWAGKTSEGEPIFVQGDAIVHPEIFRKLKNNLTKSAIRSYETDILGHTVHPGAFVLNTSAEIKHAILSFSGFHQTTLAAHAAEHRTLPAGMPELDLNEPKQRKLVEHGLMVAQYDAEEAFGEGVASGGLVTKIPGIGPLYHHYTQYLFHSFLPRIKMGTSLNALDRNFTRYGGKLSEDQIYAITAAQGNASFGGLNYRMLGRNKTIQDVLRLGLMAPDFFEARARYAGQAAKPYGREQMVALVGGAVVIYTLLRMLNEVTDRDPHWDKPFSVVYRDKEYTMRTIQEDIFRAVTDPGKYFMNRLSPVVSTAIHLGEGRNAFGRKESVGEILKQTAKQEVPIPLQPWTRESKDTNAQKAVETIAKMVGVNMKNAHEASEERLRQKERAGRETEKELEDAAKAGDTATVEKIENDPEKLRLIAEHETWAGYLSELRKLDREIKDVKLAPGISREDRRAYLDSLRDARKELLRQADEAAKQK